MLSFLVHCILYFTHVHVLVSSSVRGYLFRDKKLFLNLFMLVLLSMIWTLFLKKIFHVPFAENTKVLVFPSGSMLVSTVFYSWLFISRKNQAAPVWATLAVCLIGSCLWLSGYHQVRDLIGGIFFAMMLLAFYKKVHSCGQTYLHRSIFIFSTVFVTTIYCLSGSISFENITLKTIGSDAGLAYISYAVLMVMNLRQSLSSTLDMTK